MDVTRFGRPQAQGKENDGRERAEESVNDPLVNVHSDEFVGEAPGGGCVCADKRYDWMPDKEERNIGGGRAWFDDIEEIEGKHRKDQPEGTSQISNHGRDCRALDDG